MEPKRENTIKLRFGSQSKNPSNAEVFEFFKKQSWTHEDLNAMYREDFSLFVRFRSEDVMKSALLKLGPEVEFNYGDGSKISVNVSVANGSFKYVRIFGLPPEVDDKQIASVMGRYGKIQQLVRERYAVETGFPILNGIRGVHMEVLEEIPAQLYIHHIKARVYYEGLRNKCFTCGAMEHFKVDCPKNKSVNERLVAGRSNNGTFANIVSNGLSVSPSYSPTMVVLNPKTAEECRSTESDNRDVSVCAQAPSTGDKIDLTREEESNKIKSVEVASGSGREQTKKDKGKKRERESMENETGDSSESDVVSNKQHIVPAPAIGKDLLSAQAQSVRSRRREPRSSSCTSAQKRQ